MLLIVLAGMGSRCDQCDRRVGDVDHLSTLVALGYPPVTSTMSNAIGLVVGGCRAPGVTAPNCEGQWDRLRWQIPASPTWRIDRGVPAAPSREVFVEIVPVLLVLATGLVVLGPRIPGVRPRSRRGSRPLSLARVWASDDCPGPGTFAVGIYGGYFTAGEFCWSA